MSTASTKLADIFIGTVISCTVDRQCVFHRDSVLAVNDDGFITHFERKDTAASVALLAAPGDARVHEIGESGWLLPGFVDTHIHAPQYMNAGTALDKPLMEWLEHYTFASEARIDADPAGLGQRVYSKLVQRMIESGTTAASVFGTLTVEANIVLATAFLEGGIRGQIGKVAMDLNGIDSYIETTTTSLERTRSFVTAMKDLVASLPTHRQLVDPCITPRFVPTCSSKLLDGLAMIAEEGNLRIQSHMAESAGQVAWVRGMHDGKDDSLVLQEHGLLNSRSLMAHCTHASPSDIARLASTGTSIAHCPLSNVYFSAERRLPLHEALDAGVQVGLGSDISGGYQLGIDNSMRWAVGASRLRAGDAGEPSRAISWQESIYLATLGGAQALGLDDCVGSFEVGKSFDAQLVQLGRAGSKVDWFDEGLPIEDLCERWWCNGCDADRTGVWVQGRRLREL